MMGGSKNVFVKSAVILIVLGVLAVNGYENDDLVFDQDGRNSAIEVPLIEKQGEPTFFQRVKRGVWDWFKPPTTTTEKPEVNNDTAASLTEDKTPSPSGLWNTLTNESKTRKSRESGEENTVDHDNTSPKNEHDNDIGEFAAGRYTPLDYRPTDDEDLAGSGDVEGSATEDDIFHEPVTEPPRRTGSARFYRVTLTVSEPYITQYADRRSADYIELSRSLSKGIEELYRRHIPEYEHFANVLKISPLDSDPFTSQVTLDVGSTFGDEQEVRNTLEQQLQYHSLGGIGVSPEGFSFRNFQAPGQPECNEHTELRCRDGACIPLSYRCDNISQCADHSDELDCPAYTPTDNPEFKPRGTFDEDEDGDEDDFIESPFKPDESAVEAQTERDTHNQALNPINVPRSKCRGDDHPVLCTDESRYICSQQKCDGTEDCDDGADEKGCPWLGCEEDEFPCDVSRCILASQRCDFHEDCVDGSDESTCTYPSRQSEFLDGTSNTYDSYPQPRFFRDSFQSR